MTTILHILTSSNLQGSITRQLGRHALEEIKKNTPGATVITRDLAKNPIPHLSPQALAAFFSGKESSPDLALSNALVEELLKCDILLIEVPMYNFGVPSVLKAWIDHVVRAKKTFNYTSSGPVGLVKGKKAVVITAKGGIYSEGTFKPNDFLEPYLKAVLGFMGITDVEFVTAEGLAMGPEKSTAAINQAKNKIAAIKV